MLLREAVRLHEGGFPRKNWNGLAATSSFNSVFLLIALHPKEMRFRAAGCDSRPHTFTR